ncbi:MAG: PEP-utilizing enzyme [Candidatus Micrarchaeota archaeon]|nr:PEP-utilizing enzyme [Candidatus Micrarchaeota archaeon]
MELPKDLQGAKALTWAPYAGRNLSYFLTVMHLRETYGKKYEPLIGISFSHLFVQGASHEWMMYRAPAESERLEAFVQKRCADSAYVQRVLDLNDENYGQYRRHANDFLSRDFRNATPAELAGALKTHCDSLLQMASSISCSIIFAGALARRLQEQVPEKTVMTLALPLRPTLPFQEEKNFWQLVGELQQAGFRHVADALLRPEFKNALDAHFEAYCWLDAYEDGAVWSRPAFDQRIEEALGKPASEKIAELEKRHREQEQLIEKTILENGLDAALVRQFRLAMFHRILGESLLGFGNHATVRLFSAIAKTLGMGQNQVKWLSDDELLSALSGKTPVSALMDRLPQRQKHYLVALGEKDVHTYQGPDVDVVLSQLDIEHPAVADVTEVRGMSAYPGIVQGTARVVRHVGELDKVKAGDILVTLNTTPSFILAMKRSAAIVTDEGGITCHAAIVSRELGIPCIIGTKAGTRLIPDGAQIEVDAAKGTVTRLDQPA